MSKILSKKSPDINSSSEDESINETNGSPTRNQQLIKMNKKPQSGASSLNIRTNLSSTNVSMQPTPHVNTRKEELQIYYDKCMRGLSHSINIIKALVMRFVFSLHSLVAIIYVYLVKQDEWYFFNFIGVVFLLIELFITIIRRKGREPRWYDFKHNLRKEVLFFVLKVFSMFFYLYMHNDTTDLVC